MFTGEGIQDLWRHLGCSLEEKQAGVVSQDLVCRAQTNPKRILPGCRKGCSDGEVAVEGVIDKGGPDSS